MMMKVYPIYFKDKVLRYAMYASKEPANIKFTAAFLLSVFFMAQSLKVV